MLPMIGMDTEGKVLDAKVDKTESTKLRVLWLSDTPTCATGFAQVARNVLAVLQATGKYEIDIVGINHSDYYDQQKFPYRIYEAAPALTMQPKYRDVFGRQRFLDFVGKGVYDLVFTLQDTFVLEPIAEKILETREALREANKKIGKKIFKDFAWVYYFPIDGRPKANWVRDSALKADIPVCYTEWGKQECLDVLRMEMNPEQRLTEIPKLMELIRVIHHGVNTKEFYPIEDRSKVKQFRHEYFQGRADDKFLIVNVNRNQPRKDIARTMAAFAEFLKTHPKSFLYLHCQANDVGGNIFEIARNYPTLVAGENWSVPEKFESNQGFSVETVNKIYNAANLVISTTLGEGWGLSYTEAMATKTPVLAPRNTSAPEILGENEERGFLADAGTTESEKIVMPGDNEILRPIANIKSIVEKLCLISDNEETLLVQEKVAAAYTWAQEHSWEGAKIGDAWKQVFEAAYAVVLREKWVGDQKVGRNDPCPCGSGLKHKHCHGK